MAIAENKLTFPLLYVKQLRRNCNCTTHHTPHTTRCVVLTPFSLRSGTAVPALDIACGCVVPMRDHTSQKPPWDPRFPSAQQHRNKAQSVRDHRAVCSWGLVGARGGSWWYQHQTVCDAHRPCSYPHIKAAEEATASLAALMGNAG